jgi:hypothetical protein
MLDECYVLIPCTTLEDFPKQTTDELAKGLLAAWTAPWHPAWLAARGKLPQWFRADTVPPILANTTLVIPEASRKRLPSRLEPETAAAENCVSIFATDRSGFVAQLLQRLVNDVQSTTANGSASVPSPINIDVDFLAANRFDCDSGERPIGPDDFYALAYTWLQIQLMTRRLRYTSNLDEIYFAGRVITAAKALVQGNGDEAVSALHEAFDCLAEERDHYFSSDPHLVDLTLLAPTTLGQSLGRELDRVGQTAEPPINFLLDTTIAAEVMAAQSEPCVRLKSLIDQDVVGIAGGGPAADVNLHHMTAAEAEAEVRAGRDRLLRMIGDRCSVYARLVGETPGDIGPMLAQSGFRGAIPIDLAAGSGWKEESKLIWQSGNADLDALVARPIDASQSVGFLSLAADLGQSIDSGEIATALLVHWPDAHSDAYRDLRRAASWGLALGKFWKIDDYFRDGERPFHHYRGRADEGAGNWLTRAVENSTTNPLSSAATAYTNLVVDESAAAVLAMAAMVSPPSAATPLAATTPQARLAEATGRLCVALGGKTIADQATDADSGVTDRPAEKRLLVNPHTISLRTAAVMTGGPPKNDSLLRPQIFSWTATQRNRCDATIDIAGGGFVFLDGSHRAPARSWFKRKRRIATATHLSNEFMEVEISPTTGGILGVYSGQGRGNRFSCRLHFADPTSTADDFEPMIVDSVTVLHSDDAVGIIRSTGRLVGPQGKPVAKFQVDYRLRRGSRWLDVTTELKTDEQLELTSDPWQSYIAWRSAFSTDNSATQAPLRDMLHRVGSGKRIDSPGGLLVDEVDKQTLIFTAGRPAHRKVGDRFIDSLLVVRGEQARRFSTSLGFDVKSPLQALRAAIAPPVQIPIAGVPKTSVGWLVNCSTADVLVTDMQVQSQSPLVVSMLVITGQSESRKAKLRFCRDVVAAERETGNPHMPRQAVTHEGDRVDLALAGHEAVRLHVTLGG